MKFLLAPTVMVASLVLGVAADFEIYYVEEVTEDNEGNSVSNDYLMVPDGDPSCHDVLLEYAFFPIGGDASHKGNSRCDGCGAFKDMATWDIKELEINAGDDSEWGHYTIYEDSDYQLTPKDGGPLAGSCTRASDDEVDCTSGLALAHGMKLFNCKSDKSGAHAED